MAAATTSRTSLRKLATSRIFASTSRCANSRSFHTTAPLYLDFLAPSWRTSEPRTPPRRIPSIACRPQRRALTTTLHLQAKATTNPRHDDAGNEMSITITPRAAHRLHTIAHTDSNPHLALRVAVESGGCHGFQYLMSLVNTSDIDAGEDTVFEEEGKDGGDGGEGGYRAKVVIDEPSLELLNGSSVDYTMELIGSQFKVTGIPGAKSSCGCGTSFDVAA